MILGQQDYSSLHNGDAHISECDFDAPTQIQSAMVRSDQLMARVDEITKFLSEHATELSKYENGLPQLDYLVNNILQRVQRYKTSVLEATSQRTIQRTWANPDVLFLP